MGDIPNEIGAGLTFRAVIEHAHYPAPEWVLSLFLRGPGMIDLVSSARGSAHVFEAAASVTKDWAPGRYAYEIRATDGHDVQPVTQGALLIGQDLAAQAVGFDGRDHIRRVLDAIEAVIENRATIDQQSYSINNRSLQRTPLVELMKLRHQYRAELAAKQSRRRGGFGRVIKVRMA